MQPNFKKCVCLMYVCQCRPEDGTGSPSSYDQCEASDVDAENVTLVL